MHCMIKVTINWILKILKVSYLQLICGVELEVIRLLCTTVNTNSYIQIPNTKTVNNHCTHMKIESSAEESAAQLESTQQNTCLCHATLKLGTVL